MATTKYIDLGEYTRVDRTYDYEVKGCGTFQLRHLSHGEVRALQAKYQTPSGIQNFQDLVDELVLAAATQPKFTPETLASFTGGVDAVQTLGQHIGYACGWLTNPPKPEPDAPGRAGGAPSKAAPGTMTEYEL